MGLPGPVIIYATSIRVIHRHFETAAAGGWPANVLHAAHLVPVLGLALAEHWHRTARVKL